jgi:transcriptional antiterminator RfaH
MERWYVIHTKPWKEIFLDSQFQLRHIESFCPVIRVQPVNPRARKIQPYFPGYLFIHVDVNHVHLSQFNWMPGSSGLVYLGGEPAFVPAPFIQTLRARLEQLNSCGTDPLNGLQPGDKIEIRSGPFAGYQAIFDHRISGSERVRVLLKFLADREVWLELPAQQILPPR